MQKRKVQISFITHYWFQSMLWNLNQMNVYIRLMIVYIRYCCHRTIWLCGACVAAMKFFDSSFSSLQCGINTQWSLPGAFALPPATQLILPSPTKQLNATATTLIFNHSEFIFYSCKLLLFSIISMNFNKTRTWRLLWTEAVKL